LCQGLAYLCQQPFSSDNFPALRYLDVQNTPVNISQLAEDAHHYLVFLRINYGSVAEFTTVFLKNLQTLDLSANDIKSLNIKNFDNLYELQILLLPNNPVSQILSSTQKMQTHMLQVLDLRNTNLETINISSLCFSHLREL
jgi:Leucine-rich repeat (LRR) protein